MEEAEFYSKIEEIQALKDKRRGEINEIRNILKSYEDISDKEIQILNDRLKKIEEELKRQIEEIEEMRQYVIEVMQILLDLIG